MDLFMCFPRVCLFGQQFDYLYFIWNRGEVQLVDTEMFELSQGFLSFLVLSH